MYFLLVEYGRGISGDSHTSLLGTDKMKFRQCLVSQRLRTNVESIGKVPFLERCDEKWSNSLYSRAIFQQLAVRFDDSDKNENEVLFLSTTSKWRESPTFCVLPQVQMNDASN